MTKLDFSVINKATADSFNRQRNLIKKLAKGELVLCDKCNSPLVLNVSSVLHDTGITCSKGCTNIELEVEK
ncbi:hypothetical protein [Psychromonas sp. MME2]|uniref:hypothetical protein n=1 Tax=unclassified Psychromonas TaxID=2614957 RepID=UPI00339C7780